MAYDFPHGLGIGSKTRLFITSGESCDTSFLIDELLPETTIVKMTGDNTVGKVTAVTDKPIGMIINTLDKSNRKIAVVKTQFMAIVKGLAKGSALVAGDLVAAAEYDATCELMEYTKSSDINCGVVLVGGADAAEVVIGLLYSNINTAT